MVECLGNCHIAEVDILADYRLHFAEDIACSVEDKLLH